jgi:hypothetical protein
MDFFGLLLLCAKLFHIYFNGFGIEFCFLQYDTHIEIKKNSAHASMFYYL